MKNLKLLLLALLMMTGSLLKSVDIDDSTFFFAGMAGGLVTGLAAFGAGLTNMIQLMAVSDHKIVTKLAEVVAERKFPEVLKLDGLEPEQCAILAKILATKKNQELLGSIAAVPSSKETSQAARSELSRLLKHRLRLLKAVKSLSVVGLGAGLLAGCASGCFFYRLMTTATK